MTPVEKKRECLERELRFSLGFCMLSLLLPTNGRNTCLNRLGGADGGAA